jgi:hypothetical protein
MKIEVNGNRAGDKDSGCALCGATWGNYYEEIDGEKLFFCCEMCATGFKNMIREVKYRTGWKAIDNLSIEGNYYMGRTCVAENEEKRYKFYLKFDDNAKIATFEQIE